MGIRNPKFEEGQKIEYKGSPATVLTVSARTLQIRNVYGYVEDIKKADAKPERR